MKKNLFLILLVSITLQLRAADYYWIGGTGTWSDLNHWRLDSSTGSIPSIIPSTADNVFFGSYSGLGSARTVTVNGNAFCNNMTWESGIPGVTNFSGNGIFTVNISGNLVLASTVTHNFIYVVFTGASPATLTSNGTVLGTLNMVIDKPGSGLTLGDNLTYNTPSNSRNAITLNAGYFNAPGKTIKAYGFTSDVANTRSVDIGNTSLELIAWSYTLAKKTLNASLSTIKTTAIWADAGSYNIAEVAAANYDGMNISNTAFKKITFTNPLTTSEARIMNNNAVDTLLFMGGGYIRAGNNTIGYVSFAGAATVGGANNVIHYADVKGAFSIVETGNNTFDTLLTAPNKNIQISGTNTINKYFRAGGLPCDGFTEITGVASGTLNFASGADFDIDNVLLTNLATTGAGTITVNGIDNSGNTGFNIIPPASPGTTLYWVGGPGDWNDKSHWSTSSNGSGGACIPFISDSVVFDAGSGLAAGNHTVTTSSNAYCRGMTWAAGVGTAIFNESASFFIRIYGSVILQPTVTMNAMSELVGSDPASITVNGSTLGQLQFRVAKTSGAIVTLADDWNNTAGGSLVLASGGLSLSGRTVNIMYFSSSINATRTLDISNATLSFTTYWDFRGANKTMNATGSHIISNGGLGTDGLSYPWVDNTGLSGIGIGYPISGTTFGRMTWTNTSPTSPVFLGANNTVRRLEFKSNGSVGANCIIDSLILTGSRVYGIGNNVTINKYLMAESAACSGLMEIRGPGSIAFASGAEIHINNVYMQNVTATGPMTPIAFNGANAGGTTGWTINSAAGGPRYWVGGNGDWSDPAHWSATSGGVPGSACVPTVYDDVYFDGNSFTSSSKTVTVNNGNAYCRHMNWTGATFSPVFNKSNSFNLEIWGDLVMNPAVNMAGRLNFVGTTEDTITSNGASLGNLDLIILKSAGGRITLADNYNNSLTEIEIRSGALDMSNRTVTAQWLTDVDVATASSVNITNTIFNGGWHYRGASRTLQAAGSVLNAFLFRSNGHSYNVVNVTSFADPNNFSIVNTTVDSLVFTDPSTTSRAWIGAINTVNYMEFKGAGLIGGTGNTIDTLVFFPGNTYTLAAGTNTTITGEWFASGTPCRPTEIVSNSTTSNATVTKTSGTADFDYIRLRRITAAGAAQPFIARQHSNDMGNNLNWTIAPYDGAAPIYGLGPDTMVTAFPIVLYTDGFFGSPSSSYTWNDNSTLDSLEVTAPGTYSVTASFPDGCSVGDAIVVSLASTLPITLVSFNARVQNCQPLLNWEVADAINFSYFVVERSSDARNFAAIAQIAYTGSSAYSYTDKAADHGTIFYRLRLVDADGRTEYSAVASAGAGCTDQLIRVYPTITNNTVTVVLPQGYEKSRLYIVSTGGQRIDPVIQGSGLVRTVSLDRLPLGIYLLQIADNREIRTFKIVKQ